MTYAAICARCGAPLSSFGPEGLCLGCLLREGLTEPLPKGRSPIKNSISSITSFGDYELLEEISRGGMGVVYRARQKSLGRIVALKMVLAGRLATQREVERFRAEAQTAAQLRHPNIIAIHEVGEHEKRPYFTMDFVPGLTLAELVREGTVSAKRAAKYLKVVAEAVHCAHLQGIIHRDLKPSNVIVDARDQPRITDFGLAKRLGSNSATGNPQAEKELTLTGQILGSPNYLPPEQADGKRGEVGPHSDVYSLGAILYHLLAGRPPFQAESLTTLLRQVIEIEPVAPRVLNPNIPRDLETICLKCLEKEISRRFPSALALAEELGRFLEDRPIEARPIGPTSKVWRWCRRNPVITGLGSTLALFVLAVAIGAPIAAVRINRERQEAETQRGVAVEAKLHSQRLAYNADMALACQFFAEGNIGRMREYLGQHRPTPPFQISSSQSQTQADLRDWEWRFLWAQCQSQVTFKLGIFPKSIPCVAFTADSQRLFVAQPWGGTNSIWDIPSRRMILASPYQTFGQAAAFCTAQNWLIEFLDAPNHKEGTLFVRDVDTGQTVFNSGEIRCMDGVAISPDGRRLASRQQLWDLEQQRMITNQVSLSGSDVSALVFSSHSDRLAVGHTDGTIRLLDVNTGLEQTNFHVCVGSGSVRSLAFSLDDRLLASGEGLDATGLRMQSDLAVWLSDLETGQHVKLASNRRPADSMTFDATGRYLAWICELGIRIWDVSARQSRGVFRQETAADSLAFSPDGRYLAVGEGGRGIENISVCFYDLNQLRPQPEGVYRVLTNCISSLAFEGRGQTFLAAMGPVARFDAATLDRREELAALGTNNAFVALSQDGRLLATLQPKDVVRVFATATWREVMTLTNQECIAPRFLGSGRLLRTYIYGALQLWDTTTWQLREYWPSTAGPTSETVLEADMSSDGTLLATGHLDGSVRLWNAASRRMENRFTGHRGMVRIGTMSFSPNGRWLVSASEDGSIHLWDLAARCLHVSLQGHTPIVQGVAFSPDSRRLACRGVLGTFAIELWDPMLGQAVGTLAGEHNGTLLITFSPDGNTLVDLDGAGIAHFWHAPVLAEIEARERYLRE
jgi:eukaryotic-like serine/threonine-protein kinase